MSCKIIIMSQIIDYDTLFAKKKVNNTYSFENKIHDLKDIKRISLVSLEMPISFYNVRAANTSNLLSFQINGLTYNITIVENNYFTIVLVVNKAILLAIPATFTFTIDINAIMSNKLIASTSANITSLTFVPGILVNSILGVSTTDTLSGSQFLFSNIFNLNADSSFSFYIAELPSHYNNNSQIKGQFKVVLLNSFAQYLFYSGYLFQPYYSPYTLAIDQMISVTIFDRFGYELPLTNGMSFSLRYDL